MTNDFKQIEEFSFKIIRVPVKQGHDKQLEFRPKITYDLKKTANNSQGIVMLSPATEIHQKLEKLLLACKSWIRRPDFNLGLRCPD